MHFPLLIAVLLAGSQREQGPPIRPGERQHGDLAEDAPQTTGQGPARWHPLVGADCSQVTITLVSLDFDASLQLRGPDGTVLAEDNDGGIETNARLVVQIPDTDRLGRLGRLGRPGQLGGLRIVVASTSARAWGVYELAVEPGDVPAPSGDERMDAAIDYRSAVVQRALAVGRPITALKNLFKRGLLLKARQRYPDAIADFDIARQIAFDEGAASDEVNALCALSATYGLMHELEPARAALVRAAELVETMDPASQTRVLTSRGNLAMAADAFEEARECYERAVEIHRASGSGKEYIALSNLGVVYRQLGLFDQALAACNEALPKARAAGDVALESSLLSNLGAVRGQIGDARGSAECFEGQLALAEKNGDSYARCAALQGLALAVRELGDFQRSLRLQEDLVAGLRASGDAVMLASVLSNLGRSYSDAGDQERAVAMLQEARDQAEALGEHDTVCQALTNLAVAQLELGLLAQAREHSARAAARFEELGSEEHLPMALLVLCNAELRQGDLDAAWASLARCETLLERPSIRKLVDEQAAGARSRYAELEGLAVELAHRASEQAGAGTPTAELALRRGFQSASRWKGFALLEGISQRSSDGGESAHAADPDSLRELLLDEHTLFVEYASTAERVYAFVLGASGPLRLIELGTIAEIDERTHAFLACVADPLRLGDAARVAETGRALYATLLAQPLASAGPAIERLIIVPTPALATLPFETLVTGTSASTASFADLEYVIDRYEVFYAPSSPVAAELARLGPRRERGKLVVLADPLYPLEQRGTPIEASASVLLGAQTLTAELPRLAKTRTEALSIAHLCAERDKALDEQLFAALEDDRGGAWSFPGLELYLGAEAHAERLSGDLRGCSIVHIAAHGFVDRADPRRSGIALTPRSAQDDGFLTAGEVLGLELDADLVVLSACQTASGAPTRGEGVQSLARAFMHAGARSVVASQWQVADWAANEVMRELYAGLLGRSEPAERSLRDARLALRRSRARQPVGELLSIGGTAPEKAAPTVAPSLEAAHPFFWGPFIYIGAPTRG